MSHSPTTPETISVTTTELPLSCPQPKAPLWNAHPKVFLPIEEKGEATCPYCGQHYVLNQVADD